jgi:hypothetical protein
MNLQKHIPIVLSLATMLFPFTVAAQSKVSASDRVQIIQAILRREHFDESETWRSDVAENTVFLLRGSVSPKQLPAVKGLRFVLITQQQIDEMKKAAVEYYSFGGFSRQKSVVTVAFKREYMNIAGKNANGGITIYTCRRAAQGWRLTPHAGPAFTAESK